MTRGKKDDPEDEYSAKLDMCLTDGIVKTVWVMYARLGVCACCGAMCRIGHYPVTWLTYASLLVNRCCSCGLVCSDYSSSGVLIGALTSVLFFRRRRWPVIAGMGVGIGLAYANCEFELNSKKKHTA